MNEKRFQKTRIVDKWGGIYDSETDRVLDVNDVEHKLNEQQALITNLQGDVNRLQYIIDELKKDNYKRFEKINELKAKLREKEEDEKLYANEIVELRKTNEEWLQFKELGGDY